MVLRQSYALLKANRYAHARQYRRMRREVKTLRTYLGRVVRDIGRKIASDPTRQGQFAEELSLARRLLKHLQPACSGSGMPYQG